MLSNIEEIFSPYINVIPNELDPIYLDKNGTWHFSRYEDVKLLLSDARFARKPIENHGYVNQRFEKKTLLDKLISKWSLFNDPPEHTYLREMLTEIVNPRFVKNARLMIESVADSLLDTMLQQSSVDFMASFAYALPSFMINKLLGNTSLNQNTLREWSMAIVTAMDHGSPEDFQKATPVIIEIQHFFSDLILAREKEFKDDWISGLIKLRDVYGLNNDDICSICIFLLLAGHETLQSTIGLTLITLKKNPEQVQLLQAQPELIHSAVEELLRFVPPLTKVSRWTRAEVKIGELTIPENQLVIGLIRSANFDPARFENPEQFDITRSNNRHLTFGFGLHNCVGALLARIELQVAVLKLLPHLDKFTLDTNVTWLPNSSLQYLFKLMINIKH